MREVGIVFGLAVHGQGVPGGRFGLVRDGGRGSEQGEREDGGKAGSDHGSTPVGTGQRVDDPDSVGAAWHDQGIAADLPPFPQGPAVPQVMLTPPRIGDPHPEAHTIAPHRQISPPLIVLPARMASTRLPGKPLAEIAGRPMIAHVIERALAANLGPVVVACCEEEVARAATRAGARAVMTDPDLPSGSDRVWAAVRAMDPDGHHEIIINLQADLPTLDPVLIRDVLAPLADPAVDIATPVAVITDPAEYEAPSVVKAVVGFTPGTRRGRALYFSRLPVPGGDGPHYHHIGLYAYRRAALARFVGLPPSLLEQRERLEQLRALEDGQRIDAVLVDTVPLGVDTPEDLDRARAMIRAG